MSDLRSNNQPRRHIDDLSEAEQIEVLTKMKAFLLDVLCEHLFKTNMPPVEMPKAVLERVTAQVAEQNTKLAAKLVATLDTASVVAEAEAIIAGCCPCCGSSNVQSSTMDGRRLYDCLDCGHSWEG